MRKQIIVIGGGDTFNSYKDYLLFLKNYKLDFEKLVRKGWKSNLQTDLGNKYKVIVPEMPNRRNAKYLEWKIWFEKIIPFLESEVLLIGHSLGGLFLIKYLSEHKFRKKIHGVFLIAAPYFDRKSSYSLAGFALPNGLNKIESQSKKIFLYQSKDDFVVPFSDLEKYKQHLPNAKFRIFGERGHFNQEHFPELVKDIKTLDWF